MPLQVTQAARYSDHLLGCDLPGMNVSMRVSVRRIGLDRFDACCCCRFSCGCDC